MLSWTNDRKGPTCRPPRRAFFGWQKMFLSDFRSIKKIRRYVYPIGSMYGIYTNIWGILMVNVTIYSSTMDSMGMYIIRGLCKLDGSYNQGFKSDTFQLHTKHVKFTKLRGMRRVRRYSVSRYELVT